jgi:hypothetical protein
MPAAKQKKADAKAKGAIASEEKKEVQGDGMGPGSWWSHAGIPKDFNTVAGLLKAGPRSGIVPAKIQKMLARRAVIAQELRATRSSSQSMRKTMAKAAPSDPHPAASLSRHDPKVSRHDKQRPSKAITSGRKIELDMSFPSQCPRTMMKDPLLTGRSTGRCMKYTQTLKPLNSSRNPTANRMYDSNLLTNEQGNAVRNLSTFLKSHEVRAPCLRPLRTALPCSQPRSGAGVVLP